ncbi:uncharacterized protein [Embiotoca jacksoni]|uniref:uncharacterized protein n=1 Tax=Embiotoca jacksoni TaxID=100190 RepID=UPI003703F8A1
MKWCRLGRNCVTQPSGSIDGMRVTINASISSGFTVTMTGLTTKSSGWYWCDTEDFQMPVHVTVTEKPITTTPTPTTVTEGITVATRDGGNSSIGYGQHSASVDLKSLIIPLSLLILIVIVALFLCGNSRIMKWCRLGRDCVTQPSGSIDGMRVTINASISSGFTVTMTGLTTNSNGWYWCDTEDFQMPVHVTVTEKPITTTPTPTTVTEGITVATRDGGNSSIGYGQHSASVDLKSLIIPLSLLILIVIVALFLWFMLRRRQTKGESSATAMVDEDVTYCDVKHKRKTSGQVDEEVTYCDVKHKRKTSGQRSDAQSDANVLYSSVVTVKQQTAPRAESEAEDVTYSALAETKQNQHP